MMRIESIEEAERLFFRLAQGGAPPDFPSPQDLEFGDWARLVIYLPKPPVDSAITLPYMEAFIEIQRQIFQLGALSKTGVANATYLTEEEKRSLEMIVQVSGGSSILKVDVDEAVKSAMAEAAKKMSGAQIATVIIGLGILFAAGWGFSAYLQQQKEIKLAEIKSQEHQGTLQALTFASEKQVEMLDRVLEIIGRNGEAGQRAAEVARQSYDALLKAAAKTKASTINGQEIDQDEARAVRISPRVKAEPEIVTKLVRVTDINTDDPINIMVVIRDEDEEHRIKFSDTLFAARDRSKMFEALEKRKPIWIELAVRRADNEVRSVEILRVVDQPGVALD